MYAGMMQYDGDLTPPAIDRTMSEYLSDVKQFAISKTQKYGHVTYFFNGNNSGTVSKRRSLDFPVGSQHETLLKLIKRSSTCEGVSNV